MSLGKIDIVNNINNNFIVDNHISIIRIDNKKYSNKFFMYFFRSILGYFQIERDFTGTTNQIELYANSITNFKIPNIPLEKQQEIIDEIDNKIKEQQKINIQIEKRKK
ncbi:restriction endonuclease subunit S [Brachyspira hyodysenteriae]|uniref:restriction endonuclease subunit S n=1 Tax=Brachyspira hyodysenteriae TaxID=159 RepID=UPI0022CD879A|nr:restriction endonuclease subunit S [Brachyspira hyodysenteriae]